MKMKCVLGMFFVLLIFAKGLNAQIPAIDGSTIAPSPLAIGYWKTTNLIFPYAIKSVDKGSRDVLVQTAGGVENILQLKAAKQGFAETNLSVVTADGKFYSYILSFMENPPALNIKVGRNKTFPMTDALFSVKTDNEARTYDITEIISAKMAILKRPSDSKYDIRLSLEGIYIRGDKLYFQIGIENGSSVDYPIEALRFYIRDKKKSRRTASQEIEQLPVDYAGNVQIVRGRSQETVVMAMDRFTIPDKKILVVELMEANGGRHLSIKLQNKHIIGAKSID